MIALLFSAILLGAASASLYDPHVSVHKEIRYAGADKADVSVHQDNHQFSYKVSTQDLGHGGYGHGGYGSSYQVHQQAKLPIVASTITKGYGHSGHSGYGLGHGYGHGKTIVQKKIGYETPYDLKYGFQLASPRYAKKETIIKHVPVVKEVVRHVPVVKEVIRHVPVVKEVPVVKHVPVHIPVVHKKVIHTGYKSHGLGYGHGLGHGLKYGGHGLKYGGHGLHY